MKMLRLVALTNGVPLKKFPNKAVDMWVEKGEAKAMKCFLNAFMSSGMGII
jgi:hypothetical protein